MAGKADKAVQTTAGELVEGQEAIGVQDGPASEIITTSEETTLINESETIGTVVPEEETVSERKAVVFLGPYHSYSRADTACFDAEVAEQLVARKVAVWLKDAKKALAVRPGEFDHDTDVG